MLQPNKVVSEDITSIIPANSPCNSELLIPPSRILTTVVQGKFLPPAATLLTVGITAARYRNRATGEYTQSEGGHRMEGSLLLKLNACSFSHVCPSTSPLLYHGERQKAEISPNSLLPFPLLAGDLGSLTYLIRGRFIYLFIKNLGGVVSRGC